jgi:hypothetical protein
LLAEGKSGDSLYAAFTGFSFFNYIGHSFLKEPDPIVISFALKVNVMVAGVGPSWSKSS